MAQKKKVQVLMREIKNTKSGTVKQVLDADFQEIVSNNPLWSTVRTYYKDVETLEVPEAPILP
jgi:hypothetical protein